ncbi:MAG: hypothetical protein IAC51_08955 [bacterium]|uniref:Lipoprotein n=1 Tax=Candidatus Aphodosoma intestinipullorum TaxID=2840674 RepID=A0A940IFK8_9BACT|nr:hypothetical protein [Candidatus Aphodosoma intestinipullorum]
MNVRKLLMVSVLAALTGLSSCEKEPVYNTYENPHWTVGSYEGISESCTIVMDLPSNLKPYQDEADVVGAFIGDECRGVSTQQEGLFYIIVSGASNENGNITLRYWSARNKYMYQVNEVIPFEINAQKGTTDEPFVPSFSIL